MSAPSDFSLRAVTRRYGAVAAVDDVSLDVAAGTYVVLLGPSGSGKTTLLSILGGFTAPTSGAIEIGGIDVTLTTPAARPTATVFQDYALFPHLSVAENVGFGLSVRGRPSAEITMAVEAALTMVGLPGFGRRTISEASGGQRQRIALARALVIEPAILLLDEPLGALDLHLRRQMQDELRGLQRRNGRSFVHVTHDQEEAMAIADRIVIMNRGRVEDDGPPARVYARPRTRFSAAFMGESTILPATLLSTERQPEVMTPLGTLPAVGDTSAVTAVAIRPENIRLMEGPGLVPLGEAVVETVTFQGSFARLKGRIGEAQVLVRLDPSSAPAPGARVELHALADGIVLVRD